MTGPDAVIAETEAAKRAADRLTHFGGSIRGAFDSLGLGWRYEQVVAYLEGAEWYTGLPESEQPRVAGGIMAFAIVAVEQSRQPKEGEFRSMRAFNDAMALSAPVREVTDEELERVAKAIVADDQENNSCDPGWDAMSEPERDEYRSNARAALSVTRPIEAPGRDA